jgi:GTPase SAR1 family protein
MTSKNIIDEIAQINSSMGAPELTRPVAGLLAGKDKTIQIAVLGQFKSGKSSLINSIVGENILPVGVVPVTAIVTRLQYDLTPGVIIHFADGRQINTGIAELPLFVTEKHNPENIRKVDVAIVKHPALIDFKKVSIVDTPGLGSFYRHNSDTTLEWMPYTGAALVSVSAERPLSEEDIKLLKGIARYCPDIALVITKTDLYNHAELAEIKTYIFTSVKEALQRDIPIFEYSIFQNQQAYRAALVSQLIEPLNQDFDGNLDRIIRFKVDTLIAQSIQYAELALQSALKRENEKEAVIKLLEEIKNHRHHHEREILLSATTFKGEIRDKLEKIVLPFEPAINDKLTRPFSNDYYQWKGFLFQVSGTYEQWLKDKLGNEINILENECFPEINLIVKGTLDYFEYSALQFRRRLEERIFNLFGVNLPEAYWQIDFTGIDKPDISIYRVFDSHIDTLLFFIPMKWFNKVFYRHFKKQIPFETEKNLHRYISDVTGKIIKTIDNIHKQTLQYISNELKTVENILQQENGNSDELKRNLERLNEFKLKNYSGWGQ